MATTSTKKSTTKAAPKKTTAKAAPKKTTAAKKTTTTAKKAAPKAVKPVEKAAPKKQKNDIYNSNVSILLAMAVEAVILLIAYLVVMSVA